MGRARGGACQVDGMGRARGGACQVGVFREIKVHIYSRVFWASILGGQK